MFADDLKAKLKENHMTQREMAAYLGVAPSTMSGYVHGKPPRSREFNMICDLFEMSREKYIEELRQPKKEFTPKPQVDPKVKERESNWKNPYKKEEPKAEKLEFDPPLEEPQRCDLILRKLQADFEVLTERFETASKHWSEMEKRLAELDNTVAGQIHSKSQETLTFNMKIGEINDKINYMRGRVDSVAGRSSTVLLPDEDKKSWWKRLWE